MASGGTGRQRIDLGAMGGGAGAGGGAGKSAPEKERSSSSPKPSKSSGGKFDSKAKIKAAVSVGVILLATGFILRQLGFFDAGPMGGTAELRPLTPEEKQEQDRIVKEQELPKNMRLAQPPPAGAN